MSKPLFFITKTEGGKTEEERLVIELLDDKSLEAVNRYLKPYGVSYKRFAQSGKITIKTAEKGFNFWDRLMRVKPGFSRGENEK